MRESKNNPCKIICLLLIRRKIFFQRRLSCAEKELADKNYFEVDNIYGWVAERLESERKRRSAPHSESASQLSAADNVCVARRKKDLQTKIIFEFDNIYGWVAERLNARDSKSCIRGDSYRGFKSLLIRQLRENTLRGVFLSAEPFQISCCI